MIFGLTILICKNFTLSEQDLTQLLSRLKEYRDVFLKSETEFGRAHRFMHEIDIGNNPPFRQRPYRILLDTGSGTSVIELGTLRKIGLENRLDQSSAKPLINASGDKMNIIGSVDIKVPFLALNLEIKVSKVLIHSHIPTHFRVEISCDHLAQ